MTNRQKNPPPIIRETSYQSAGMRAPRSVSIGVHYTRTEDGMRVRVVALDGPDTAFIADGTGKVLGKVHVRTLVQPSRVPVRHRREDALGSDMATIIVAGRPEPVHTRVTTYTESPRGTKPKISVTRFFGWKPARGVTLGSV